MEKFLSKMLINRPLVFLCGVAIPKKPELEKRDRRLILKKEITERTKQLDNNKNITYQVMPIIVDYILKDKITKGMSMSLLEEIVSAISYKTYIFLDSMATSYELGLFTNSNTSNDVRVLVGKGYKTRANCQIGEYIQKAHKDFIEYTVEYNEKGFSYFFNDKLPMEISKVIDDDISEIENENREIDIKFCDKLNSENEFGTIFVSANIDKLKFQLSIKTLFYIVDGLMKKEKVGVSKTITNKTIEKIKNTLFYNYVSDLQNKFTEYYFFKKPSIEVSVANYNIEIIIKHILCVILAINENNKNGRHPVNISIPMYYQFKSISFCENDYKNMIYRLFKINSTREKLINNYKKKSKSFCRSFVMKIHKKKKKMITYENNYKGRELRNIHSNIKNVTEIFYKSSNISYAYKKGSTILNCLNNHYKSTIFYKLDISNFFNSISKSNLKKKYIDFFNELHKNVFDIYRKDTINKYLSLILDTCFYNNCVPIGFVSSPILSDIYLNCIDKKMEKKKIVITRYADDYLLSTHNVSFTTLDKIVVQLTELLKKEKLDINKSKVLIRKFEFDGDSIKFLGVNIVYDLYNDINRFTISNKYIVKTSKMLGDSIRNHDEVLFDKCLGRINYIKDINVDSYQKFLKIFFIHTGFTDVPISLDKAYALNNIEFIK